MTWLDRAPAGEDPLLTGPVCPECGGDWIECVEVGRD